MDPFELRVLIKEHKISQQFLAELAKCSQAQISRLLKMGAKKGNPKYEVIVRYVTEQVAQGTKPKEEIHPVIMGAILRVWDGTDEQARKIAQVINSLQELCN